MTNSNPKDLHSTHRDEDRLRAMLAEDTGSAEEAEALLDVALRLKRSPAPRPAPGQTTALIEALRPALVGPAPESYFARLLRQLGDWPPLLLLRAQLRVVRGEIWLASMLVMVLGTLVTLVSYNTSPFGETLPLVLIAPIVTAVGVGFVYGTEVDPALEITLALPISPRLVLLARLALVFAFDLVLGLAGSVILTLVQSGISLWPLVIAWLAPMTFLSALAFLLSVLFTEPLVGGAASLMLWVAHIAVRYVTSHGVPALAWLAALPDLTRAESRPWMVLAALLMGVVAMWLAGQEERWIKGVS